MSLRNFSKVLYITVLSITLLTSCGSTASITNYSAEEISTVIINSQSETPALTKMNPEEDFFTEYATVYYQIDTEGLTDGAIYYSEVGTNASEIAVLSYETEEGAVAAETALSDYKEARTGSFTGYLPDQEAMLEAGNIVREGTFLALIVCEEPEQARDAFLACFSDNPPELPEEISLLANEQENVADINSDEYFEYTPEAILLAWETGDTSVLTPNNLEILNIASEVINELITEEMSDFEKEFVLHEWIINRTSYDNEVNNQSPDAAPTPNNDNPYGLLVHGKSICSGYTDTFQLFMDMVGVECISVDGTSHGGTAEHAWNMVCLDDGEWYCVDLTWDDPTIALGGNNPQYEFFNVTSRFMRTTDHQWEDEDYPEASATLYHQHP